MISNSINRVASEVNTVETSVKELSSTHPVLGSLIRPILGAIQIIAGTVESSLGFVNLIAHGDSTALEQAAKRLGNGAINQVIGLAALPIIIGAAATSSLAAVPALIKAPATSS